MTGVVIGNNSMLLAMAFVEKKRSAKTPVMTILFLCWLYVQISLIIHHCSVKNHIYGFDDSNYLWQAALLSSLETWTRGSLAL